MKNWGLTAMYIVVMLLGFFELYRTFRFYKWDKKAKQLATAPYVIYFGTFISAVLIIVPVMFLLGDTNPYIPHQMAKKLGKDDSNLYVWQIYLISTVILFSGFVNFFK